MPPFRPSPAAACAATKGCVPNVALPSAPRTAADAAHVCVTHSSDKHITGRKVEEAVVLKVAPCAKPGFGYGGDGASHAGPQPAQATQRSTLPVSTCDKRIG